MIARTAIAVVTALLLMGRLAQAQSTAPQEPEGLFGSPSRFTEPTGAAIYQAVCTGCHMANGRGAIGAGAYPALADNTRLAASGYPIWVVLHGQRAMPPFGKYLSNQQVADVVGFIRQNFGNAYTDMPLIGDVQAAR